MKSPQGLDKSPFVVITARMNLYAYLTYGAEVGGVLHETRLKPNTNASSLNVDGT